MQSAIMHWEAKKSYSLYSQSIKIISQIKIKTSLTPLHQYGRLHKTILLQYKSA